MSKGPFLRKYGVAATFNFDLFEVDGVDFRIDAADSGANCTIMKDEGAEVTCTNDFADEGSGYSLVLTATEMQAARIKVYIIDAATKVWLDTSISIETYGNASAAHAFDLDTALVTLAAVTHTGAVIPTVSTLTGHTAQTGDSFARLGAPAGASIAADIADTPTVSEFNARTILSASYFDPSADTVVNVTNVATLTGHTVQTGDSFARLGAPVGASISADIADIPTVSEFNARTILSADYFDPSADTVTNVTNVAAASVSAVQAAALADFFDIDSGTTYGSSVAGSVVQEIADNAGGGGGGIAVSVSGTADSGSATTMVDAARIEAQTNYWNDSLIRFTSGTLDGVTRLISGFDPGTDTITFFPSAPVAVATHNYEILPAGAADVWRWRGADLDPITVPGTPDVNVDYITGHPYWTGTADSGGSASTLVDFALNQSDDDYWKGLTLLLKSGSNIGISRLITAFNNATNTLTVSPPFPNTIASGVTFSILPSVDTVSFASVNEIQVAALADLFNTDSGETYAGSVAGSVVKEIVDNAGGSGLTLADIADAVWDELTAGHSDVGSFGEEMTDLTTAVADIPTVSEFNARTILAANYFDPATDTVVNVTNVATLTGHTPQTGDSFARIGAPVGASISADIADLPTISEFNARTILSASYFDPAADTVVNVTNVATLTGHTAQTGDNFTRLGAPTGASVSADIAVVQGDTDDIQARLPGALVSGRMDSDVAVMQPAAANTIRDATLPTQNEAFPNLEFLFVAASDHVTPVTGATSMAVTRSIDGGSFGAGTGTLAEVGNGMYQYDASAADMNGGVISFRFTATGGTPGAPDDVFVTIVTTGGV